MQSSGTKRSSASVEISETMLEAQISAPFPRMAHTLMEARGKPGGLWEEMEFWGRDGW